LIEKRLNEEDKPMTKVIELINFPGAPNLPIFVANEKGFFKHYGVEPILETTPSSIYQIKNLISGKYQIAGTAIDNVVAYVEGQGPIDQNLSPDIFAFMGATKLELSFVVAPEIEAFFDLKGKTIALDALNTGFAFILYRMLENAGISLDQVEMVAVGSTPDRWAAVKNGDHVGTLTIEPFTTMAVAAGFKVLESSLQTVDSYQGGSFAARRSWAGENEEAVRGFIAGYLQGLDWTLDPENRGEGATILLSNMPNINPKAINKVMDKILSPHTGLSPNAEIDKKGFETVLELRSRYGGSPLKGTDRYIDLSFYDKVMASRLEAGLG
jgi:ABC-type nitrate/sulfonate/bicarbonate transport system substrate-binding protein